MQTPDARTPVSDLLRLAVYHRAVLKRFPELKRLLGRIEKAEKQLQEHQAAYDAAVRALAEPRAVVKVVDFFADKLVSTLHSAAMTEDGGRVGPVTKKLFPEGKAVIVDPVGEGEIEELSHLEKRLADHGGDLAKKYAADLAAIHKEYVAAVAARKAALVDTGAKRMLRNQARTAFVEAYSANAGAIKEAFPRDRRTQDLFFDDVRQDRATSAEETGGDAVQVPPAPAPLAANG